MTHLGREKEVPNLGRLVREERHAAQRPVVPRLLRSALERHVEDEALDVGVARVAVASNRILVDGALVGAVLAEELDAPLDRLVADETRHEEHRERHDQSLGHRLY